MDPRSRELNSVQFICNSIIPCLRTINSSILDVGIIVCAACPTPRLNLSFELRPSWNNIHDTFPTGTALDTTKVYREMERERDREAVFPSNFESVTTGLHIVTFGNDEA